MPSNVLTYPRGFQRYLTIDDGVLDNVGKVVAGDQELETLYRLCVNRQANPDGWTYRSRVLQSAIRLFGDFAQWMQLQERNPYLYGMNYDFLQDTYAYIRGQQRMCSPFTWIEIMNEHPQPTDGRRNLRNTISPADILPTSRGKTPEVIAAWCARPDGFEDMLFSMHVMFGYPTVISKPWEHPPT